MKTIKVIDLLNMISKGEKVPKEIKVNDNIYHYDETDCNEFYRYRTMTNELLADYADLNDEVEIIEDTPKEEKKIPEKIEYYDDSIAWVIDDVGQLSDVDKVIIDKLNDLLDYLKSKRE